MRDAARLAASANFFGTLVSIDRSLALTHQWRFRHGPLNFTLAFRSADTDHHPSRPPVALTMAITTKAEAVRVPEQSVESSASAVEWAAIIGGALAAVGISIILFTLGSGLGLSTVSPWSWSNPSPTTFGMGALGGYHRDDV